MKKLKLSGFSAEAGIAKADWPRIVEAWGLSAEDAGFVEATPGFRPWGVPLPAGSEVLWDNGKWVLYLNA